MHADLLVNPLLALSGLAQPAQGWSGRRGLLSMGPAILGLVVGEVIVAWLTLSGVGLAYISAGIVGLVCKIAVVGVEQFLTQATGRPGRTPMLAEAALDSLEESR